MIGLVIVSHSAMIAQGVKEMAEQMTHDHVKIVDAGGTADGRLGTDAEKISKAINQAFSGDGVLILYDIGSSMMSSEIAVENLPDDIKDKVLIVHAPIVEGAFIAAVEISIGKSIYDIKSELENLKPNKLMW